jgi:hypothetical protein
MLNARTVAAILFLASFVGGVALTQEPTLEQNWNDYLHYTTIGNLDLAKGYARRIIASNPDPVAMLELSQANPNGYDLAMKVVETSTDTELTSLTRELVALIDRGRFERRSDPMIVVEEIKRLSGTERGRFAAIKRLKDAGEYAIPFMLDAMADPARRDEMQNIIQALPQIGRHAIRPLVAALQTDNSAVKAEIIKALGKIGYPQSLPYLAYVLEKDASSELRSLASQSMRQIDPRISNVTGATLFFQLGEKYYYHDESLAPQEGAPIANIWFWDSNSDRLARAEVNPAYFNELMSMRCCEWALKADESFGRAIGLWLAAFYAAEATGLKMPDYFGDNHAGAMVYATTAGPEYLQQALARALNDGNAAVALGAVEALATNAGEKSLMFAVGSTQPLLQALSFSDKSVSYTAAIAIGNAGPRQPFNESHLVVENLSQALGEPTPEGRSVADSYAGRAAAALLKVAVSRNPVIDLSLAQLALINATTDSRPDIQTIAAQILAYLTSPDAQRAIASMALNPDGDMDIRIAAFHCLADSAKMHGNLLVDLTVGQIYDLVRSNETQTELRAAAAGAYGALNLPSQQVRNLILDQAKS